MDLKEFSVGFRNIKGLHDDSVCKINEIKRDLSDDIEILVETWGCKCKLEFEDYFLEYVSPQKHMGVKKGRNSGGFIVLFKNYLAKNVKIIKKSIFVLQILMKKVNLIFVPLSI